MSIPATVGATEAVPFMRRTVEPSVAFLLFGVTLAGLAAAIRGGFSLAWLLTPAVALLIVRGAVRSAPRREQGVVDWPELPAELRQVVDATYAELPAGDARRLLAAVLTQARPLYANRESAFDARQDAASLQNASDLVVACCATAGELARIDGAMAGAAATTGGAAARASDIAARYKAARDLFARRLTDAASALGALYASDVEHGTPVSDRVADLAAEINADAKARSGAAGEMAKLLDTR